MNVFRMATVLLLLVVGLVASTWSAAEALTIGSGSNPQTFSSTTASVTRPAGAAGTTTNNGATLTTGTSNFNQFNSSLGVLTEVTIALTSSSRTGSLSGQDAKNINISGSGTAQLAAPGQTATLGAVTATVTPSASGSYSVTGATDKTGATLTITNPTDLSSYVGGGQFSVTRTAPSLSVTTGGTTKATVFTETWSGTLNTTYTYLLHSLASFQSGSTQTSLTIDFNALDPDGIIHQGDGGGQLSTLYSIFNRLATDRIGLDLTSFTPGGGNSTQTTTNLATFSNLASGNTGNNFTAFLNTTQLGTFTSTFTIHLHDICSSANTSCLGDSELNLTVTGVVEEPLPPSLMLMGAGLLAFGGTFWVRLRRQGVRIR